MPAPVRRSTAEPTPAKPHPAMPRGAGAVFLACGIVFMAVALATGQYAFLGVGSPFLTLGIVFLATGRKPQ